MKSNLKIMGHFYSFLFTWIYNERTESIMEEYSKQIDFTGFDYERNKNLTT